MADSFAEARRDVALHARQMWELGLVTGTAGNVSRRAGEDHLAITPTSLPYDVMTAEDIVLIGLADGQPMGAGEGQPSYELPMHLQIYRGRSDVQAVVHTHAPFVSTLAVLRRPLPPVIDEMILYLGGTIEVSEYAFTGTEQVGINVLKVLGERAGVIMANHGNVCVGRDLGRALHAAMVMEAGARVYVQALAAGEPFTCPTASIDAGLELYRQRSR